MMLFSAVAVLGLAAVPSDGVTGWVRFDGPRPESEVVDLRTDPLCSAKSVPTVEPMRVGPKGGVADVFVYVENGPSGAYAQARQKPAVLDQIGCRYVPQVLGVLVGQPLEIRNSDATVHMTRADIPDGFNVVTPRRGQRIRRRFGQHQVMVPVRCDVHPWMIAYVGVLDHPFFAVTDDGGRWRLPAGLPDGHYRFGFWHSKLGRHHRDVQVAQGRATIDIVLKRPQR
ncbi:MAG: hypothetical protein AAF449_09190 [Myxococcota bacterium]